MTRFYRYRYIQDITLGSMSFERGSRTTRPSWPKAAVIAEARSSPDTVVFCNTITPKCRYGNSHLTPADVRSTQGHGDNTPQAAVACFDFEILQLRKRGLEPCLRRNRSLAFQNLIPNRLRIGNLRSSPQWGAQTTERHAFQAGNWHKR